MNTVRLVIRLDQLVGAKEPASWTWDSKIVGTDVIGAGTYTALENSGPSITETSIVDNTVRATVDTRDVATGTYHFQYAAPGQPSGSTYRANIEVIVK